MTPRFHGPGGSRFPSPWGAADSGARLRTPRPCTRRGFTPSSARKGAGCSHFSSLPAYGRLTNATRRFPPLGDGICPSVHLNRSTQTHMDAFHVQKPGTLPSRKYWMATPRTTQTHRVMAPLTPSKGREHADLVACILLTLHLLGEGSTEDICPIEDLASGSWMGRVSSFNCPADALLDALCY